MYNLVTVDIATKDNVAIFCKDFSTETVDPIIMLKWLEQAATCLSPDKKGYAYKAAIISLQNDKQVEVLNSFLNQLTATYCPSYVGKIMVSKISEVKSTLDSFSKNINV